MRLVKWVIVFGLLFFLAACGSDEPATSEPAAAPSGTASKSSSSPSNSRMAATAEEVAREARGKLKCPPKIKTAARAADAPVDDVLGVRPGMSFEEAADTVMCTHDLLVTAPAGSRGFKLQTYGQQIRQGFSARFAEPRINKTSKEIMQEMQDNAMARGSNRVVRDMAPGQAKWFVGTMGLPGEERVISAAREEWFAEGRNPTVAAVRQALLDKYGTATSDVDNRGTTRSMSWAYDPFGRHISETSPLFNQCRGVADPDGGYNLSPDCGTVITAMIYSVRDNPDLAEYMQVGVVDQSGGYEAIQATEQGFEAMEAARRAKQIEDAANNADAPQL